MSSEQNEGLRRSNRQCRISQYWELIQRQEEPKTRKNELVILMHDLKDEGNALFKEREFHVAWMHYKNALFVANILHSRYYHDVEKHFVSTLYSNRALCCIKQEMFSEALKDCESATNIDPENVKAIYRHVLALKGLNRYVEAMKIAEIGMKKQPSVFNDLIEELKLCHPTYQLPIGTERASLLSTNKDVQPIGGERAALLSSSKDGHLKDRVEKSQSSNAHNNINADEKTMQNSKKKGKKAKKSTPVVQHVQEEDSSEEADCSSDSDDSLGQDEKFANQFLNIQGQNVKKAQFGNDVKSSRSTTSNYLEEHGFKTVSKSGVKATSLQNVASLATQNSSGIESISLQGDVTKKAKKQTSTKQTPPTKKVTTKTNEADLSTINFPLESEYEFKLACSVCFVKLSEGSKGHRYVSNQPHDCSKNLLLVQPKKKSGTNWVKVRPYPQLYKTNFGVFKLCQQFSQGLPCKIGEERCTFLHNDAERELWNIHHKGAFNIEEFIYKLRELNIDCSEKLRQLRSKHKYIPGLTQPSLKDPASHVTETFEQKPQVAGVGAQSIGQVATTVQPLLSIPVSNPRLPVLQTYPQVFSSQMSNQPLLQTYSTQQTMPVSQHGVPLFQTAPSTLASAKYASGILPQQNYAQPMQFTGQSNSYSHLVNDSNKSSQNPSLAQLAQGQSISKSVSPPVVSASKASSSASISSESSVERLENPLKDTYDYKIVCQHCFKYAGQPGFYIYYPKNHKCEENILALHAKREKGTWLRVRERLNHRDFKGQYLLCYSVTHNRADMCRVGEEGCSYAHNSAEQHMWTLEKDGKFNITEFIMQNRRYVAYKGFTIQEMMDKHGGYFIFICKPCFYSTLVSEEGAEGRCTNKIHYWANSKIMSHFGPQGAITIINPRGFLHKTAFFKICRLLHFCKGRINGECRFAHSMIERDIWMIERDLEVTREQMVQESNRIMSKGPTPAATAQQNSVQTSEIIASEQPKKHVAPSAKKTVKVETSGCPFVVLDTCGICWKRGISSQKHPTEDKCVNNHINWSMCRVVLLRPNNKEIRSLPNKIPSGQAFIVCRHVQEKHKCDYTAGKCQYAHSKEEVDVWKWMVSNKVKTLDALVEQSKKAQQERTAAGRSKIASGEPVISVTKQPKISLPTSLAFNPHYCHYCSIKCNSSRQWDEHCASDKHMLNVNSDKEHQWNYRQPPWDVSAGNYELCSSHANGKRCTYSNLPEMYNLCRYAHSQEELDEWKERYDWRQMKRELAKKENLFSYMDQLQDKFENTSSPVSVISEYIPGVQITTSQNLNIFKTEKNASYSWIFTIYAEEKLEKVALLQNQDRLHFNLQGDELGNSCQIAPGEHFEVIDHQHVPCYRVVVHFTGGMFGSFSQWVIFDFGKLPVLVKKLSVELGDHEAQTEVKTLRESLKFDRWTGTNCEIVSMPSKNQFQLYDKLLRLYKAPDSSDSVVTQQGIVVELNRHNYVHKMHKMLELEEITRWQIISSYNLCTEMEVMNMIEDEIIICCLPGELFARIPLAEYLTEDTDAGKLIIESVIKVLISLRNSSNKKVYEVDIAHENNFNFDGRGKHHIYLCLPPVCVQEMSLQNGKLYHVEVQFQMDRLPFCLMHYALDKLKSPELLFPDVSRVESSPTESCSLNIRSHVLNKDQMKAVKHIIMKRATYNPPLVIYGPFGTGKTETLAQAAMVLLKERPESRILICAQSNSAADIYITKHFDAFLKKNSSTKLRRLCAVERRLVTVHPGIRKYCILSPDGQRFISPTKEDIMQQRVIIVTIATSLYLIDLDLQDYFTHIFIDEAAQVLECQALLPLSLATEKTCVVLAGDHLQISPKVYSPEARRQNFQISLLERLYKHYSDYMSIQDVPNPLNILLTVNYRTKMEILRFISAIFYGGPEKLKSESHIPPVLEITPLIFYTVNGVEMQDEDSTSYYNIAEVMEVVERVDELYNNWPTEWGQRSANKIGVVAPYRDQVQKIRRTLRKKDSALQSVHVDRVNNVQGREFRALFISVVRTQHLLESHIVQKLTTSENCDGDCGDFGFLSDPKLLNTALTRTQSFVAVIGDPVALCAIGDCLLVWKTYLKHCQNMNSIIPRTVSLDVIRQHVYHIHQSPRGIKLAELANQSKNNQRRTPARSSSPEKESSEPPIHEYVETNFVKKSHSEIVTHLSNGKAAIENKEPNTIFYKKKEQKVFNETTEHSGRVRPVLSPPVTVSSHSVVENGPVIQSSDSTKHKVVEPNKLIPIESHDLIKQITSGQINGSLHIIEGEDFAVIHDNSLNHVIQKVNLPAQSCNSYPSQWIIGQNKLLDFLRKHPQKYKKCILYIEPKNIYAEELNGSSEKERLNIVHRSLCGTALSGDEVVVEKLTDNLGFLYQVIGILRKAVDSEMSEIICTVDYESTGLLIPEHNDLPKMYNLIPKSRLQKVQENYVCVYSFSNNQLTFSHYEKVDLNNASNKLFLARYIKWYPEFKYPFAVVTGVVQSTGDFDSKLEIVKKNFDVFNKFSDECLRATDRLSPYRATSDTPKSRTDLTDRWTFSVAPSSAQNVSVAYSIEQFDQNYLVTVHVTDLNYFVKKDSVIDQNIEKNLMSYFPCGKDPLLMLPPHITNDLSNLIPQKDHPALSICMTVEASGEITSVKALKSIINLKKLFTFDEAEATFDNQAAFEEYLSSCVVVLYQMSKLWRQKRLGTSHWCSDTGQTNIPPRAYHMTEEIKIVAECEVAKLLLTKYPYHTPLYIQPEPFVEDLEWWRKSFASDAINSVAMTKPFLQNFNVCQCKMACTCIFGYIKKNKMNVKDKFEIMKSVWEVICHCAEMNDYQSVRRRITNLEGLPQVYLAYQNFLSVRSHARYVSSGEVNIKNRSCYELNLPVYTTITNPVHNYMDFVTQRMLLSYIEGQASPYNEGKIREITWKCTRAMQQSKKFEAESLVLLWSHALKEKPLMLYSTVESLNFTSMNLLFPSWSKLSHIGNNLEYRHIGHSELVKFEGPCELAELKWQEKIYDATFTGNSKTACSEGILCPNPHVTTVPAFQWQKLLGSLREDNTSKLQSSLQTVRQQARDMSDSGTYATNIVCEGINVKSVGNISFELQPSHIIQTQLASHVRNGHNALLLQLISLSSGFDICLEHRSSTVECFSSISQNDISQMMYKNEVHYQNSWIPILEMEASKRAVTENNNFIINNVQIHWTENHSNRGIGKYYLGHFQLSHSFCNERQILLEECTGASKNVNNIDSIAFLCVRYSSLKMSNPSICETSTAIQYSDLSCCWVGHCCITSVVRDGENIRVEFRLNQSSVNFPIGLLHNPLPCTVEIIRMAECDRLLKEAVLSVASSSQFVKDIVLEKRPQNNIEISDNEITKKMKAAGLSPSDDLQLKSIVESTLKDPLTVIHTPPGTGKYVMLNQLVCMFVMCNASDTKKQLMICASTEESLNIVEGNLGKTTLKNFKVVRVYNEQIVRKEFPVPRDTMYANHRTRTDLDKVTVNEDLALHCIIRKSDDELCNRITEYDMLFQYFSDDVDEQQIAEYHQTVKKAEINSLKTADIILCTCFTSAKESIKEATNVRQIIINDSNMCSEPESLIPMISSRRVEQLVLIGDHKQTGPTIWSRLARNCGLHRSLFERYSKISKMLVNQYTLHESIMEFPSSYFYDSKLKSMCSYKSDVDFFPNGYKKPIMFCNVCNKEEYDPVGRVSPVELPVINRAEAQITLLPLMDLECFGFGCAIAAKKDIVHLLHRKYRLKPIDIAILTPYDKQCQLLRRACSDFSDIHISTISESIGREWNFIIVSCVRSIEKQKIDDFMPRKFLEESLGVLADQGLMNVALTRARQGLIIIGNKYLLYRDPFWHELLNYYEANKKIVDAADLINAFH